MRRTWVWLPSALLFFLLCPPGRTFADEATDAKAQFQTQAAELETMLENAARRYRSVLVGKLKNRAGAPLPDKSVLRPLSRAQQRLRLQQEAIPHLEARLSGTSGLPLSKKDFARTLDRMWGEGVTAVWGVLLDEATQKVRLLQQSYDEESGALRQALSRGGDGAKADVARREGELRRRVERRFRLVATRLRDERLGFLRRLETYATTAADLGRAHVRGLVARLLETEFSLDERGGMRSKLVLRLQVLDLTLGSVVGAEPKRLRLADALRPTATPPPSPLEQIELWFDVLEFDGVPYEEAGVEEGGLLTLRANLYPADLDFYEVTISVERGTQRVSSQIVKVRREGESGWRFVGKPMRVAGGALDPVPAADDPAGERRIEAAVGDRIVVTFKRERHHLVVKEARPTLRFVRRDEEGSRVVSGELLFGVPYELEARFLRPQDDDSPEIELDWHDDTFDHKAHILMVGFDAPDGHGRHARFRSRKRVVLVDKDASEDPRRAETNRASGDPTGSAWFHGTWQVTYLDEQFEGGVEGVAHVVPAAPGQRGLQIRVDLKEPGSDRNFHLRATRFELAGDRLKLELRGQSPSRAGTYDGKAHPRAWPDQDDLVIRRLKRGTVIDASLGGMHARVTAQPSAHFPLLGDVQLELRRQGDDTLSGTWSYADGEQGFYGQRIGDRRDGRVSKAETWLRGGADSIRSVREMRSQRRAVRPEGEEAPHVSTQLEVTGYNLPQTEEALGNSVSFDDPHIKFDAFVSATPSTDSTRSPGTLRMKVRLLPGVVPGQKSIRVVGVVGSWALQFADDLPRVTFLRVGAQGRVQTARMLAMGDTFVVSVQFRDALPFTHRLAQFDIGREPPKVLLTQDARDPRMYHSATFRLVARGARGALPDDVLALPVIPESDLALSAGDTEEATEWASIRVLDSLERAKLIIHPPGRWLGSGSLSTVLPEEPFGVRLRLPGPPTPGPKLVTFKVRGGARAQTIALQSVGGRDDAPVSEYVSRGTVTIARGDEYSAGSLVRERLGTQGGFLDTKSGDVVDVTHGDAKASLTVYGTSFERRLAVRKAQVGLFKKAIASHVNTKMSAADREIVKMRLQMATNALALVAQAHFQGYERVAILEAYLGLLQEPDSLHDRRTAHQHPKYGISMVSRRESEILGRAVSKTAKDMVRDFMADWGKQLSITLASFVGDLDMETKAYMFLVGHNGLGKRVRLLDRAFAGCHFFGGMFRDAVSANAARLIKSMTGVQHAPVVKPANPVERMPLGARRRVVVERLHRTKMDPLEASKRADALLERHPDLSAETATVVAARQAGIDVDTVSRRLGLSREEVTKHLDDFYRRDMGVSSRAEREQLIRSYTDTRRLASEAETRRLPSEADTRRLPGEAAPPPRDIEGPGDAPGSGLPPTRTRPGRRPPGGEETRPGAVPGQPEPVGEMAPLPPDLELRDRRAHAAEMHQGREPMDRVFEVEDQIMRAEALARKVPQATIDHALAARKAYRERAHAAADAMEQVRGYRSATDYKELEYYLTISELNDRQRVLGLLWARSGQNVKDNPAFLARRREQHQRIPGAFNISRAEWEQDLRVFLRRNYGRESPPVPMDRLVADYFRFVDRR